jgi:hypothetical protein
MEHKDMPCEKISTGEVFIWDRWDVSLLRQSEEHARVSRTIEYVQPEKKKKTRKKKEEEPVKPENPQLSLFEEE